MTIRKLKPGDLVRVAVGPLRPLAKVIHHSDSGMVSVAFLTGAMSPCDFHEELVKKEKRPVVRSWHYCQYFTGPGELACTLEFTEEQVRKLLNSRFGRDNWKQDSLKQGKKRKLRPGEPLNG